MQLSGTCSYKVFQELMVITLRSWRDSHREHRVQGWRAYTRKAQSQYQNSSPGQCCFKLRFAAAGRPPSGTFWQRLNHKCEEGHVGDPGEEAVLVPVPFQPETLSCGLTQPFSNNGLPPRDFEPRLPTALPASLAFLLLRWRAITRTYSGPVPKLAWDSQIFHFWFRIRISKAEVRVLIWNKLLWASESRRRPLRGRKRESDRRMDRERAGRRKDEGEGIFGPSEGIRAVCVCVREKDRETERRGRGGEGEVGPNSSPSYSSFILYVAQI